MQQFDRIFKNKLDQNSEEKTPVLCMLQDYYQSQRELIATSHLRRERVAFKNQKVAQENMRYRQQLAKRITMSQQKSQKKHSQELNKVVKAQQRKRNYRKDIFGKHLQSEKKHFRDRVQSSRQHQAGMKHFWAEQQRKTFQAMRDQQGALPLHQDAVVKKKQLERRQNQQGMATKSELLRKTSGRWDPIHKNVQKQLEIHQLHTEKIEKVLSVHEDIMSSRQHDYITSIGEHFDASKEVLKKNHQDLAKKLKDKKIDEYDHHTAVKDNRTQRYKTKSNLILDGRRDRIRNFRQSVTKSQALKLSMRASSFTQTIKRYQRQSSQKIQQHNRFLSRTYSVRDRVKLNQQHLLERRIDSNTNRIGRENNITSALKMKQMMEVEGNCYVRKAAVK